MSRLPATPCQALQIMLEFVCKFNRQRLPALLLTMLLGVPSGAPGVEAVPLPLVVCTTAQLGGLVQALAGNLVQVDVIVAWGMCPGHFELKRSDIRKIRAAELVLSHGIEKFLAPLDRRDGYAPVTAVTVHGNWMTPPIHQQAAVRVAEVLAAKFPNQTDTITANLASYQTRLAARVEELRAQINVASPIPAVCSVMNADLARWLGLRVVAEFQRDDDLSLRNMHTVLQQARQAGAHLVVDNRQSSGKIGKTIARQLNVPLVILSNFPEPDADGNFNYFLSLDQNVRALRACL